ncbi:MAG: FAD-dependent monooxygenase, partial [Pseudomonadota bacterium]
MSDGSESRSAAPQEASASVSESDVLIIGGGLVGASLAVALEPLGLRVTVLEALPPRGPAPPSYDDRTLALGSASCHILEGIGLWSQLAENATPIREVTVTELGRPGRVVMNAPEMGLDRFGNVIEARTFGQAVMKRVEALDGVRLDCPAVATGLEQFAHVVRVTGERKGRPATWQARLVIGADGAA